MVLTNTAINIDDLGFATLDANAPIAPAYKAIDLPSASLDDYVGTYKLADKFLRLTRRALGEPSAQALFERLQRLEAEDSLDWLA